MHDGHTSQQAAGVADGCADGGGRRQQQQAPQKAAAGGWRPCTCVVFFSACLRKVVLQNTTTLKLACQHRQAAPAGAQQQELERCVACGGEQRVQQPRHAARLVEAQLAGGAVVQRLGPVAALRPHLCRQSIASDVPIRRTLNSAAQHARCF